MKLKNTLSMSLSFAIATAAGTSNLQACPLLGQQYPPPSGICKDPSFQAATKAITSTIQASLNSTPYNLITFSIGIFDTSTDTQLYEYHHTDASVAKSAIASQRADANSIYRLGSVTKVLTAYLYLVNEGDRCFNDPIAKWVPGLVRNQSSSANVPTPDWEEITIGDLLGQMGGLARDYGLGDISAPGGILPSSAAFPPIPSMERPVCAFVQTNGTLYLNGLAAESAIFPTAYTPAYSNEGFALLGIILARISGQSNEALFNSSIVEALGLSGTRWLPPSSNVNGIIPGGAELLTGWSSNLSLFSSAGGANSTTNDLAKLGKAMLSSKLLSKSQTRRWFKPTSFVEEFAQGVGRPWEIFRVKVAGHSVDMYSKSGDWGAYHSFFALVPEYDIGFTILSAESDGETSTRDALPNVIVDKLLPAVNAAAKKQASANFAGHYNLHGTNSTSLTITTDAHNALQISQWSLNGTDFLVYAENGNASGIDWRLLPNQLYGKGLVGFTGFYQTPPPPPANGTFFWSCKGWTAVDQVVYGNVPVGQMVFEVDGSGRAAAVELKGFRTRLERVEEEKDR